MASPSPSVVATWRDRAVHIWVWDGATWVPTFMAERLRELRDRLPPPGVGQVSSVDVRTPGGEPLRPMSIRLDRLNGPVWLASIDADEPADSLRWFATAARAAAALADAGWIAPELSVIDVPGSELHVEVRWAPLPCKQLDETVAMLDATRPAITALGALAAADVIAELVDGTARRRLAAGLWSADLPRDRRPATKASRAVFRALAGADPRVAASTPDTQDGLADLGRRFERHRRRANGTPVLLPRLRLAVPDDDPLDPWSVELELVDEADPGRWCSAGDVWNRTPLAVEVAAGPENLGTLEMLLRSAAATIAGSVDIAGDLARADQPVSVELDIDDASEFLEEAPAALERHGIPIIGPEQLIRGAVAVRGTATPAPPADRKRGFDRDTIVRWSLVVDEADGPQAITDAEVARAAASGSTLLHTGRRWVRIDPAALRRARRRQEEYEARTGEAADALSAVELLRLAADTAAAGDDIEVGDAEADRSAEWSGRLLGGLPDDRLREEVESKAFTGELRHYQRRALSWLRFLARLGLGGCLADDMGLGKTATALAHLVDRPGPHLVVCPLSVVHNWETEASRFVPSLPVTVHHGTRRNQAGADGDAATGLVVTTYGLLARDIDHLAAVDWDTVVLDEAQFVKNPATKGARAVRRLAATQRLALTGTPVENRLAELWSILDGVNPGVLGSRESFRHRFAKPIERGDDDERTALAAAELRKLTQPFVLRRTKADRTLLPDLPDKIEQLAYAGLTREQATLYQHVVDRLLEDAAAAQGMKRRGLILASINRLKQICNHPAQALGDGGRIAGRSGKLTRFDELVDELADVGERALVFTQYVAMGKLLQRHLATRWPVPFLHGGVGRRQRTAMIDRFQDADGDGPPVMVVSLKAGGTGLNLTAATQVIHYDRWWNPAVENQATDRAWRIGQRHTVLVHKLMCTGTIEERIDTLINEKQALADLAVGAGEQWLSELSTADLNDLVRLDRAAAGVHQ